MRRALVVLLVLALIASAASVFWRYNTFVYQKALREAPPYVRLAVIRTVAAPIAKVVQKVIELPARLKMELVKWFPFSEESALREWEEKVFKGKVVYTVEQDTGQSYVRAQSEGKASALYYKIKLDTRYKHPVITWKWRVNRFPKKQQPESLESQDENDFAARVYVIIPDGFITNWKVIEYVWTETLPAGTTGTSPYSQNIKQIVVRSGPTQEGEWFFEERDVISDYTKVFGQAPTRNIGAVAFMTNAEHTGTSADALYDEIKIGYAEDNVEAR